MVPPTIPGNVTKQNGEYPIWKAPDRESEGWRWRDGAFGSVALMSFDAGGEKEKRRARAATASTPNVLPVTAFIMQQRQTLKCILGFNLEKL